jgi:hypothetical protein
MEAVALFALLLFVVGMTVLSRDNRLPPLTLRGVGTAMETGSATLLGFGCALALLSIPLYWVFLAFAYWKLLLVLLAAGWGYKAYKQGRQRTSGIVSTGPTAVRVASSTVSQSSSVSRGAAPDDVEAPVHATPSARYSATRLLFRASVIEPLNWSEMFRVDTPDGSFQMSKSDFYWEFSNVVASYSYSENGIYHYPEVPAKAMKYLV